MSAPDIDLLSEDFIGDGMESCAWLRRHSPVHRDAKNGLWGLTRYDDVVAAERDPLTYSNAGGARPDTGPLPWMIDLDAPEHLKRRKIVSAGFTPKRVRASEDTLRRICDDLIDAVCERGECDLVHDLAAPLPLIVIADMLGVAPEDRGELLAWSDALLGSIGGGEERLMAAAQAFFDYSNYATRVIAERRERPTDDLVSVLVHAEIDGERLDEPALIMESLLILVGGDETTRHVISGGIEALVRHPGQLQQLRDDRALLPVAVEEMLRWVSPINSMNRTLTRDVVLHGQRMSAGDKVLMLYKAANFDDTHFVEPDAFDITRAGNDHIAFGTGPHFCLGASLARVEIAVMVDRVLDRLPDLRLADDAPLPRFLGQLTAMPVRFTPTASRTP
jgi:cytochrome P450 family 142 subfamily A polypeptide 1